MRETTQVFIKGVNERIPRDRQTPDRLNKLQNARLNKRGETLFVSRIEGHDEWLDVSNGDYVLVIDQTAVGGEHDTTTGYLKGYLLRFEDFFKVKDENSTQGTDNIIHDITVADTFSYKIIPVLRFADSVGLSETFVAKTFPVLRFTDSLQVADLIIIPTRFTLSFTDAVTVVDRDLSCLE